MVKDDGETTQWSKLKERQPNGQRRRRDNTMVKDEKIYWFPVFILNK
jgi:hypothetical protein